MITITTDTNLHIGVADGTIFVQALDPRPADVRTVLEFLAEIGWVPLSEDEHEVDVLEDGSTRIWFKRS